MVPGKRYAVFAIRTGKNRESIWIRAGVAYVQPDDSMNLTLDVLPIDGQLHIREVGPKHQQVNRPKDHEREEPAAPTLAAQAAMGGH